MANSRSRCLVFKGYLFDEAATARAMSTAGSRPATSSKHEPNGEIRIVDRKKDILITSGGKNITPSLIENALKDSPYIREAVLIGEGRHFLSALIQIDLETTGKWAQERHRLHHLPLARREHEVRELIEAEIAASTHASRGSRTCANSSSCRRSWITTTAN